MQRPALIHHAVCWVPELQAMLNCSEHEASGEDFTQALKQLRLCSQSALRLKATFTDAYNNLASALVQKGSMLSTSCLRIAQEHQLARQRTDGCCSQSALWLGPTFTDSCDNLASALMQTGSMLRPAAWI